jgi:hypothetical protein
MRKIDVVPKTDPMLRDALVALRFRVRRGDNRKGRQVSWCGSLDRARCVRTCRESRRANHRVIERVRSVGDLLPFSETLFW